MNDNAEEDVSASCEHVFDQFVTAVTCKSILASFNQLLDLTGLRHADHSHFYEKLKAKLKGSWKAQNLWAKLDKRASHRDYKKGQACSNIRVLIIGAGPCGLRTAIESAFLGAKTVIVEKRDRFSRNNVLHLWPYLITDLRNLGAKKFFGKFCAGAIDHISIRQLQCILLKVALLLGVEVHVNVTFEELVEPPEDQSSGLGWRCRVIPENHAVSEYEFDVLIGADGKRNTLPGFKRKEFRGKLAIAVTANFINRNTQAEARVQEISGVAFIFNQKFFMDLKESTRIDLENIVYYKDDTHYFVMTAKKASLLEKGVLKEDFSDTVALLDRSNVNQDTLMAFAREAADFSTNYQLPSLDYAVNHYGQADVAMFDFTSMFAAENASRFILKNGHHLLMSLVGDSLLEPFWPTGSGCARGFLSAFDAAWMIRSWALGKTPLQVLAERESIYTVLSQTTPSYLNKNHNLYSLDPNTRYPNLNQKAVKPGQVRILYEGGAFDAKDFVEEDPAAIVPAKRPRNAADISGIDSYSLLRWCQRVLNTGKYRDVHVVDFTSSWRSGLALCALINSFRPDLINNKLLMECDVVTNNQLAFGVAEKELGIPPVLTGEDMARNEIPDKLTMVSYLTQFYDLFKLEPLPSSMPLPVKAKHIKQPKSPNKRTSFFQKLGAKLAKSKKRKEQEENEESMLASKKMKERAGKEAVELTRYTKLPMEEIANRLQLDRRTDIKVNKTEEMSGAVSVTAMADLLVAKFKSNESRPPPEPIRRLKGQPSLLAASAASEFCSFCHKRVYIMERMSAEGEFFHRGCLRCDHCGVGLRLSNYSCDRDTKPVKFYCYRHAVPELRTRQQRKRSLQEEVKDYVPDVIITPAPDVDTGQLSNELSPRGTASPHLTPLLLPKEDVDQPQNTPERVEFEISFDGQEEESEEEQFEHNLRASLSSDTLLDDEDSDSELSDSDIESGAEEEVWENASESHVPLTLEEACELRGTWIRQHSRENLADAEEEDRTPSRGPGYSRLPGGYGEEEDSSTEVEDDSEYETDDSSKDDSEEDSTEPTGEVSTEDHTEISLKSPISPVSKISASKASFFSEPPKVVSLDPWSMFGLGKTAADKQIQAAESGAGEVKLTKKRSSASDRRKKSSASESRSAHERRKSADSSKDTDVSEKLDFDSGSDAFVNKAEHMSPAGSLDEFKDFGGQMEKKDQHSQSVDTFEDTEEREADNLVQMMTVKTVESDKESMKEADELVNNESEILKTTPMRNEGFVNDEAELLEKSAMNNEQLVDDEAELLEKSAVNNEELVIDEAELLEKSAMSNEQLVDDEAELLEKSAGNNEELVNDEAELLEKSAMNNDEPELLERSAMNNEQLVDDEAELLEMTSVSQASEQLSQFNHISIQLPNSGETGEHQNSGTNEVGKLNIEELSGLSRETNDGDNMAGGSQLSTMDNSQPNLTLSQSDRMQDTMQHDKLQTETSENSLDPANSSYNVDNWSSQSLEKMLTTATGTEAEEDSFQQVLESVANMPDLSDDSDIDNIVFNNVDDRFVTDRRKRPMKKIIPAGKDTENVKLNASLSSSSSSLSPEDNDKLLGQTMEISDDDMKPDEDMLRDYTATLNLALGESFSDEEKLTEEAEIVNEKMLKTADEGHQTLMEVESDHESVKMKIKNEQSDTTEDLQTLTGTETNIESIKMANKNEQSGTIEALEITNGSLYITPNVSFEKQENVNNISSQCSISPKLVEPMKSQDLIPQSAESFTEIDTTEKSSLNNAQVTPSALTPVKENHRDSSGSDIFVSPMESNLQPQFVNTKPSDNSTQAFSAETVADFPKSSSKPAGSSLIKDSSIEVQTSTTICVENPSSSAKVTSDSTTLKSGRKLPQLPKLNLPEKKPAKVDVSAKNKANMPPSQKLDSKFTPKTSTQLQNNKASESSLAKKIQVGSRAPALNNKLSAAISQNNAFAKSPAPPIFKPPPPKTKVQIDKSKLKMSSSSEQLESDHELPDRKKISAEGIVINHTFDENIPFADESEAEEKFYTPCAPEKEKPTFLTSTAQPPQAKKKILPGSQALEKPETKIMKIQQSQDTGKNKAQLDCTTKSKTEEKIGVAKVNSIYHSTALDVSKKPTRKSLDGHNRYSASYDTNSTSDVLSDSDDNKVQNAKGDRQLSNKSKKNKVRTQKSKEQMQKKKSEPKDNKKPHLTTIHPVKASEAETNSSSAGQSSDSTPKGSDDNSKTKTKNKTSKAKKIKANKDKSVPSDHIGKTPATDGRRNLAICSVFHSEATNRPARSMLSVSAARGTIPLVPKASADEVSDSDESHFSLSVIQRRKGDLDERVARRLRKIQQKQQRRAEQKRLRMAQEIQRQLEEVEVRQRELEERGIAVEKALRGDGPDDDNMDESQLMSEWFTLVHEKNALLRYESELNVRAKELELEDRQARLELDFRERSRQPEDTKTDSDITAEGHILDELLNVVEQRNTLVAMLEEDRLREQKEDSDLKQMMAQKGFVLSPLSFDTRREKIEAPLATYAL